MKYFILAFLVIGLTSAITLDQLNAILQEHQPQTVSDQDIYYKSILSVCAGLNATADFIHQIKSIGTFEKNKLGLLIDFNLDSLLALRPFDNSTTDALKLWELFNPFLLDMYVVLQYFANDPYIDTLYNHATLYPSVLYERLLDTLNNSTRNQMLQNTAKTIVELAEKYNTKELLYEHATEIYYPFGCMLYIMVTDTGVYPINTSVLDGALPQVLINWITWAAILIITGVIIV